MLNRFPGSKSKILHEHHDPEVRITERTVAGVTTLRMTRGKEEYRFVWDAASKNKMLLRIGIMASDRRLSLNWYDVAVISQRIRR